MKKLIYIVLFAFVSGTAQNLTQVTYKVNFDFGLPSVRSCELIFSPSIAYYTQGVGVPGDTRSDIKILQHERGKFKRIFTTDLKSKKLTTKAKLNDTFYLATENLPDLEWEIHHQSKDTIMGFVCTKATSNVFRGRSYTAWFTTEIPVPFGPWKLQGLPGLILEATDNLNNVIFVAEKIEPVTVNNFNFGFPESENKYKSVTLKAFVEAEDKYNIDKFNEVIAKMPRGSSVVNITHADRGGMELKYEWEEK